ncbi:hypothetical protein FACS189450_02440 [Spirochaetia bacterium]|nr:hypothetical protein FACS189450_02440 [Spirochaetia bacterium]
MSDFGTASNYNLFNKNIFRKKYNIFIKFSEKACVVEIPVVKYKEDMRKIRVQEDKYEGRNTTLFGAEPDGKGPCVCD